MYRSATRLDFWPRQVIFIHGICLEPLGFSKKKIMISKVTSDQKLHGRAWNRSLCLPHATVHAPHNMLCVCEHREECRRSAASPTKRPSLKCFENRLGISYIIYVRLGKNLQYLFHVVRNSPNRSREEVKIQHPKGTKNHTKPSWVTYLLGTFWESYWITLCLRNHPKPSIQKESMQRIIVLPQTAPFNAPAEALSFLLQLLDGSFFRRTASGLPCHCGVTLVAPSGNWVFFGKIAMSAEMQRHVLPLSRDTKTWLQNTANTRKPSPRVEREQRSYRFRIVTYRYDSLRNKYKEDWIYKFW